MTFRKAIPLAFMFLAIPAFAKPQILSQGKLGEFDTAHRTAVAVSGGQLFIAATVHLPGEENPLAKVHLWTSPDAGKTWSTPRKLTEGPFEDTTVGLGISREGTLLLNYSTSLQWALDDNLEAQEGPTAESRKAWWNRVKGTSIIDVNREINFWIMRSTDQGANWTAPSAIPCNPLSGAVSSGNDRLFIFGHRSTDSIRQMINGERNNFILTGAVSEDDGVNWKRLKDLAAVEGDNLIATSLHESSYTVATDGNIVVAYTMRNPSASPEARIFTVSDDDAMSWSLPAKSKPARAISLLTLDDHRLLMLYTSDAISAADIQARTSSDDGKTWEEAGSIISNGGTIPAGFSTASLADHSLITVWLERTEKQTYALRYQIWKP